MTARRKSFHWNTLDFPLAVIWTHRRILPPFSFLGGRRLNLVSWTAVVDPPIKKIEKKNPESSNTFLFLHLLRLVPPPREVTEAVEPNKCKIKEMYSSWRIPYKKRVSTSGSPATTV